MLTYFKSMARADVTNLEPTTHTLIRENRTREDRTESFGKSEAFLDASPEREDDFFLIPNVL
jgi:aspartyl-tRNA(Asn)/glutamyl-tRNA(Gln) amidotransferase subunit C